MRHVAIWLRAGRRRIRPVPTLSAPRSSCAPREIQRTKNGSSRPRLREGISKALVEPAHPLTGLFAARSRLQQFYSRGVLIFAVMALRMTGVQHSHQTLSDSANVERNTAVAAENEENRDHDRDREPQQLA
jgi:hypothetical protein